jgi:hypothetical protein
MYSPMDCKLLMYIPKVYSNGPISEFKRTAPTTLRREKTEFRSKRLSDASGNPDTNIRNTRLSHWQHFTDNPNPK